MKSGPPVPDLPGILTSRTGSLRQYHAQNADILNFIKGSEPVGQAMCLTLLPDKPVKYIVHRLKGLY